MSVNLDWSESGALGAIAGERRALMVTTGVAMRPSARPALNISATDVQNGPSPETRFACLAQQDIYIDESVHLEASLKTGGGIYVMGAVKGGIMEGAYMFVAPGGQVEGNATFASAVVYGRVAGRLTVSGNLTLQGSAEIDAVVTCGRLEILPGARLNGSISTETKCDAAPTHRHADTRHLLKLLSAPRARPGGRWLQFYLGCVCGGIAASIAMLLIS